MLALMWSLPAQAQVHVPLPDVRVDLRYDRIDQGNERHRLQTALRLQQQVRITETVSLVGFVVTGGRFASRWVTWADLRDGEDSVDPFRPQLRQLYGQYTSDTYRWQVGAIPPVKAVISPTGLDPAGWIDGARFEWYFAEESTMEFVVGRLGEIRTPSVFDRPLLFSNPQRTNYAEMEISKQLDATWRGEFSVEHLRVLYLRSELRRTFDDLEWFVEMLYNTDSQAFSYGATLGLSGLPLGLDVDGTYANKDAGIGLRGELADDFFTFGHSLRFNARIPFAPRYGFRWFMEVIIAERPEGEGFLDDVYTRFNTGLNWRLPRR
ncbi:MAG: hypothetical protein RhofKO_37150 [Rhodothermales bacterium]